MNKKLLIGAALAAILGSGQAASAHVVVRPNEVGIGQRLNFVVSVPTEEDTPTIQVRLVIPEGVRSVRPNVKPGWTISVKREGEGESERVTEITWSGGRIPAEQRDEFIFSAQAPVEPTTLAWKAYQTYGSGNIVSWNTDPKVVEEHAPKEGEHDDQAPKPWSETRVVDDLTDEAETRAANTVNDYLPTGMSVAALAISFAAFLRSRKS